MYAGVPTKLAGHRHTACSSIRAKPKSLTLSDRRWKAAG